MSELPDGFEVCEKYKPLPTATKQIVLDKTKGEKYILYKLNKKEKLNSVEIGKKLSKVDHSCLAKYDSSTDNQIFLKYPKNMVKLTKSVELDDTAKMFAIYGVACALNHLHAHGIIHGNLSFSSILINQKGKIKICDYGIATKSSTKSHTRFKAKELLNGEEPTDKSDIYAFGVFVYKLIAGVNPYPNKDSITQEGFKIDSSKVPDKFFPFIVLCLQNKVATRPSMETIIKYMLEHDLALKKSRKFQLDNYTKIIVPNTILFTIIDKKARALQEQADRNNGKAMVQCADLFLQEDNFELALKYYTMAAKNENREGQWKLGLMYEQGKGVDADPNIAVKYYEKSARQDSPMGLYHMGRSLKDAVAGVCDKKQARGYLQRASDYGVYEADYLLSDFYEDEQKKAELLKKGADIRYPPSEFKYGVILLKTDQEKGMDLIIDAVKSDVGEAQLFYGKMLLKTDVQKGMKLIRKACDIHKIPEAQCIIGEQYLAGTFYKKEPKYAFKYVKSAAKKGYLPALYRLASYFENGIGTEVDYSKVDKNLNTAAIAKYPPALYLVGLKYINRGDQDIGLGYIQEAANLDFPEAILKLHELTKEPIPKDQKKLVKNIKSTLAEDFPSIVSGSSSSKNTKKQLVTGNPQADALIKKADSGDSNAMYEIGKMFYYGQNVPASAEYAAYYLKAGADAGNVDACLMYFLMLKSGQGVQQDVKKAFKYCKSAVDKKSPQAMFELGSLYQQGIGCKQDMKEASKYYKMGADLGNMFAQYSYGTCLEYGAGVAKNPQEAIKYYSASAQQSFPDALFAVARCLETGFGVPQNMNEAIPYYRAAANAGSEPAKNRLKELGVA